MEKFLSGLSRRKFLWMSAAALVSPVITGFRGASRAMGKTESASQDPVLRGVYTKAEEQLLAKTNKWIRENKYGWLTPGNSVATKEAIRARGLSCDPWNPLWSNDSYAVKTKWGEIMPFPCYEDSFGGGTITWHASLECGHMAYTYYGDDYEFFRPIRAGDKIRTWSRGADIKDTTPLDGKGPRKFEALALDVDRINQKDELVCVEKKYVGREFYPEQPNPPYIPDHGYTEAELKFLYDIARQEEIRGSDIRYWEDVTVGDTLQPVVFGPTSILDVVSSGSFGSAAGPRIPEGPVEEKTRPDIGSMGIHVRTIGPWQFIPDPETGLLYKQGFGHYDDRTARASGFTRPFLFAVQARHTLLRLITNWMGDDGFIRRFKWRHMTRSIVGDAFIGYGKVVDKRKEKDEYLVDLKVWLENIRGFTPEAAVATVKLVGKKEPPPNWR